MQNFRKIAKIRCREICDSPNREINMSRKFHVIRYLAKFMPHPSDMTEPLTRLEDKNVEFQWLPQHSLAMNTIKKSLTETSSSLLWCKQANHCPMWCKPVWLRGWSPYSKMKFTSHPSVCSECGWSYKSTTLKCNARKVHSYILHITQFKVQFARYGIPEVLISNNDPEFGNQEFKNFSTDWQFEHRTSGPRYPQANAKVENAVKTCKGLLLKAKEDKRDPLLAILSWPNTPSEGFSTSPVQRLMDRRMHTLLPTAEKLLQLNSNLKTTARSLAAWKILQCKQYYSTSFPWRWERQSEWSYLGNRNGSYVAAHVFLTDTHMKFR